MVRDRKKYPSGYFRRAAAAKKFMLTKGDEHKHLRVRRPKKIPKEKPIKPVIRRITQEIYVERMGMREKEDGIPLTVLKTSGEIVEKKLVKIDEYDVE